MTFHGRDIFAPTAAHLAQGVSLKNLGDAIDPLSLQTLTIPEPEEHGNQVKGTVQYGDRFGNLITNIEGTRVSNCKWQVHIGSHQLQGQKTYADTAQGQPVALIGSHGWVEVAVNGGSARDYFKLSPGESITISLL